MYLMKDWYSKYVGTLLVQFSRSVVFDSLQPHDSYNAIKKKKKKERKERKKNPNNLVKTKQRLE